VASYNTSDFKKGLKIQIGGEPYLITEFNFRKPGKGNALYECKMKDGARRWRRGRFAERDVNEIQAASPGDKFVHGLR
jgi:translation elongation factor P/translation initiation factor 5A